jgi:hypothetical protein
MSDKQVRAESKSGETAHKGEKGLLSRAVRSLLNSAYNTYYMPRM